MADPLTRVSSNSRISVQPLLRGARERVWLTQASEEALAELSLSTPRAEPAFLHQGAIVAIENAAAKIYGVQYHPEARPRPRLCESAQSGDSSRARASAFTQHSPPRTARLLPPPRSWLAVWPAALR